MGFFDSVNITTTTKTKVLKVDEADRVKNDILINHFDPNENDYYLFLVEGLPKRRTLINTIDKDIQKAGYKSYIVASATVAVFDKEDITQVTEHMLTFVSEWEDLISYQGKHVTAIMPFGAALYSINKCADLTTDCFYDMWMNKPYYYLGHGFIGNFDTFIFPVDGIDQLFPNLGADFDPTNWKTRFFRAQLLNMKNGNKELPMDMSDYKIIRATDLIDRSKINGRFIQHPAKEILETLKNAKLLAWDTETDRLKWQQEGAKLVCITASIDGKTGYYIPFELVKTNPELRSLWIECLYSCEKMVGANIKFDLHWMMKQLPELDILKIKCIEDVGQLSHAINSNRTKGLKPMSYFYTPFGGYDNELDRFKKETGVNNYSLIPDEILYKYATIDAIVTWRIYVALRQHAQWIAQKFPNSKPLKEWTAEKWYDDIMKRVYPVFTRMEHRGMMIDRDYMLTVRKYLQEEIPKVKAELCKIWNVPEDFKFGSTKELGKQIERMGWPCVERSKAGDYATSDDCIQEWKRQNRPGIKELIKYRELNSFLGTFIGEPSEDGNQDNATGWEQFVTYHPEDDSWRIHQEYIVMGTETFRCIGKNPNLQNVPAHSKLADEVKRCITVPTTLHFRIESDDGNIYEGGELDTVEVEGKGRISLALVSEEDNIIPQSFQKYKFAHDEVFDLDEEGWVRDDLRTH